MADNGDALKEKLKNKLKEIFQFENEDLDFGIYRIMNYKRKEIERFIEEELIENIKRQLQLLSEEEKRKIEEKLREISSKNGVKKYLEALEKGDEERARIYREDFAKDIEEYERLKKQLQEIQISEDLEREIYNHLINFFSRYYNNGDFISLRRYGKKEKYVIPYNGEEVLLYWANKDQYYIKTTEYFRRYRFEVPSGNPKIKVNFRVVVAEEEKGNVKSQEKKFFVLNDKIYDFDEENKELNIYFEYRALTDEEKEKYGSQKVQDKINEEIIRILDEKIPEDCPARLIFERNGDKTYIEKHLYRYTRRNTMNYFIHKDLKGFLERELDFYIKNEFLQLEDLEVLEHSGYFDKLRLYLTGVKVFRNIAMKIIEFLAQIENFQKKIWEKKKFVIDTHYVITLDKIKDYAGEEFLESILDEILSNENQLKEWKGLFEIEVKDKDDLIEKNTLQGKEWKKLPIDTKYFDDEFKWKLLVALSKNNYLDEILDGILIKSENWQTLNLLMEKYREKVKCIYIDPPYNTGNDEFLYKDNYQHSSWLTMMENRLKLARELMIGDGVILINIDNNEMKNLLWLLDLLLGRENFIENIIWRKKSGGGQQDEYLVTEHDYITFYAKDKTKVKLRDKELPVRESEYKYYDEIKKRKYKRVKLAKWGSGSYREDRPTMFFPLIAPDGTEVYPKAPDGRDGRWRYGKAKIEEMIDNDDIDWEKVDEDWIAYEKVYLPENRKVKERSIFYDVAENAEGANELKHLFGLRDIYTNPKPSGLIFELLLISSQENSTILDFFAGSGTTAHAVMKLNKEDSGKRKFILVEIEKYFDTVIIPRIKKVAYSFNWKDGKPLDSDGTGVFFKYQTLEQYEDALENIEFEEPQKKLYEFRDYFVKYFLEWETKKSKTFLNIDELKDPFNYKLKIIENYQQKVVNIDLIETFNYLIGLQIKGYKILKDNGRKYVFVFGWKDNKKISIVWRSIVDIDLERDKEFIEENIRWFEPDEIYINGDALVNGFKPIEPEFKALMFEKVE